MFSFLSSRRIFATVALLFAAAVYYQLRMNVPPVVPTGFTLLRGSEIPDDQQPLSIHPQSPLASGPTLPPDPWEEDGEEGKKDGNLRIASGPTLPPDPWQEDDNKDGKGGGNVLKASGPTLPPDPYDDEESKDGGNNLRFG